MGLGRGPAPGADVPRRPAPPGPPAAQGPRRRRSRELLRAAQDDKRLLVRVTVEMLLRTGLRVSEYTSLRADAVVQIGAAPWLHVPVGKLREDRYLPLHPHLVALIDDYRTRHVAAGNPLLLPGKTANPPTGTPLPATSTRPAPPPGCPISTLTSSGTLWLPRPDLPRVLRTAYLWLFHAADCRSKYSSRTCCGVRY